MADCYNGAGAGAGAIFPVIFYDGIQNTNMGSVVVYPTMDFNTFRSILSRKMGIPANQYTVYITHPCNSFTKINNSKFWTIFREKDSWLFVVLNRRKTYQPPMTQRNRKEPPKNVMLLKRNVSGYCNHQTGSGFGSAVDDLNRAWIEDGSLMRESYLRKNNVMICQDCLAGETGFHLCVNDAVILGFRSSPAGAIARPGKSSC